MKGRLILVVGAAVCVLLGSAVAFAASNDLPPSSGFEVQPIIGLSSANSFVTMPEGSLSRISVPEIKAPEIMPIDVDRSVLDMSIYEQFGLAYDMAKGGYVYNGKLIGLFVDQHGRGITFLSQNGEVHVKAVRDDNGNLIGLTEMSADEYSAIASDMAASVAEIEAQLERDFAEMQLPKPPRPDIHGGIPPDALEQHMSEVAASLEQQMNEVNARLQQRMIGLHTSMGR